MANFCSKCSGSLKEGAKFCPDCGASVDIIPIVPPSPLPPPPPPPSLPRRSSGCGVGCLIGCLITAIVFLVIIAVLVGLFYYFFLREKDPGNYFEIDSASKSATVIECTSEICLDNNLKTCSPSEGDTAIGDFAEAEIKILGKSEDSKDSCVVYAKITEVKELPEGLDSVPDFVLDSMLDNLSLECLVPQTAYKQGIEYVGEYISNNMVDICKGPLLDFVDKFGIEI